MLTLKQFLLIIQEITELISDTIEYCLPGDKKAPVIKDSSTNHHQPVVVCVIRRGQHKDFTAPLPEGQESYSIGGYTAACVTVCVCM